MSLTTRFGNLLDYGFLAVPNLLLEHYESLGITDDELLFIIKCLKNQQGYKIHDNQLTKTLSTKTMQRRRNSLKEKGFLEIEIHKTQHDDGTFSTDGIVYDFKKLILTLNMIADKLSSERSNLSKEKTKVSVLPKTNKNTSREIPEEVKKFMSDYKIKYGVDYNLSDAEKLLLNNASERFIKSIPYIFDYVKYQQELGNLPEPFLERLIFFQKVHFRQTELIQFAEYLINEEEISKEMKTLKEETLQERSKFFNLLIEKNITFDSFINYLQKSKNLNYIYFKNGNETKDVFKNSIDILYKGGFDEFKTKHS